MYLWGVAVLELDSHPEHNKGPDYAPCSCPTVHGNELTLFWAKAFPLFFIFTVAHLT